MTYKIDYNLYSILLREWQEDRRDCSNKEYLLNYFLAYEEVGDKYICVDNTCYTWRTVEYDTYMECIVWLVNKHISSCDFDRSLKSSIDCYWWITSFIKSQNEFLCIYEKSKKLIRR